MEVGLKLKIIGEVRYLVRQLIASLSADASESQAVWLQSWHLVAVLRAFSWFMDLFNKE